MLHVRHLGCDITYNADYDVDRNLANFQKKEVGSMGKIQDWCPIYNPWLPMGLECTT